ncbi:MAG: sulfate transporter, ATPase subunit [Thermoleophilia bacterium]|nr:sulfate transporter, ATPase subunit [Thermoleophilia bacterium]
MGIELEGVTRTFGGHVAVRDVSLHIPDGSLTALLGPSGSGKSTLLRIVGGLEVPDAGRVLIDGRDVTRLTPQDRGIGFVFQHYAAFRHMTVYDNVAFGMRIRKRSRTAIRERVTELLALVQLEGFADRYPSQLSGGQRQRMALARSLAIEPEVLLLDEPFGALDAKVRRELRTWLRHLHDDMHVTTVIVTHDQEEAMDIADEVAIMDHGVLQQVGAPREVYEQPGNEFVMGFLGPVNAVDGQLVRPHDLEISQTEEQGLGWAQAHVERVVHLGFEVRVEIVRADGWKLWAQLTRDEVESLGLDRDQTVWVRSRRARTCDETGATQAEAVIDGDG